MHLHLSTWTEGIFIFRHFTTHPQPCLAHPSQLPSDIVIVHVHKWHCSCPQRQCCDNLSVCSSGVWRNCKIQAACPPSRCPWGQTEGQRSGPTENLPQAPAFSQLSWVPLGLPSPSMACAWLWPVATESKEDRRSHPKINHGPEWVNRKLGQRRGLVRVWKERELCLSWEDECSLPVATALRLCCALSCPQVPGTQCIFSAEFWPLGLTLLLTWTPLSLRKDPSLYS